MHNNRLVIIGSPHTISPKRVPLSKSYLLILSMWIYLCASSRASVKIASNYNFSLVNGRALVAVPLEVPENKGKHIDPSPIAHTPINQRHSIWLHRPSEVNLDLLDLRERMLHVDYQMIYEQNPPGSIFEERYNEEYHILQIRQFFITIANPSEVLAICINDIFSDCQSIKKMMKKPLPICINPFTKYPLYFNLYVTHFKTREIIKNAVFFNVTLKYSGETVVHRMWMREVKFSLLPNHLKLLPFQVRNCQQQNTVVSIKNPQRVDLSFLLVHKFKKYHTNGQPLDDKFTIGSQKTFRFMVEAKDSTITIYSKPADNNSDRAYPALYVPVVCYDRVALENFNIGLINQPNLALIYPVYLTSNTNAAINIEEVSLTATSGTVELLRTSANKAHLQSSERNVQIASIIVRSALKPTFKNSVTIKVRYSFTSSQGSNNTFQIKKIFTYTQLHGAISVGQNRFYQMGLPEREYTDLQKIQYFNYSITNHLQIPIRMQRILFNTNKFRLNWFKYTGTYIFPQRIKEEIMLVYTGPKNIPISPVKYAAAIDFSGGIFVPFQLIVFDRTLACLYQGKETRCSALKYVNFGYQKNEQKVQTQTIVFRNFNPNNVTMFVNKLPQMGKSHGLQFSLTFSEPYPSYDNHTRRQNGKIIINLHSGHYINLTIEMKIIGTPVSGEMLLNISTEYQKFSPKIKFNFQQGRLLFTPSTYEITHSDRSHRGTLHLLSTFQQSYQIREVISDTISMEFFFNQSHQWQPNQQVPIPFLYNPYRDDNNLTSECCSEDFLKNHYLHSLIYYQESTAKNHQVTVVTNADYEQHLTIKVDVQKANLLQLEEGEGGKKLKVSALSIAGRAKICLPMANPYPSTLKYNVFFVPDAVTYKPKDYLDYFKHAKRERVDAFFCFIPSKKSAHLAGSLKQFFRLEQSPIKLDIGTDSMGNINYDQNERNNLSNNQYVASIVQTGSEVCYKIHTLLYFKLLIESEVVNAMLDGHSLEVIERFVEKEWQHLQNSSIAYLDDEFYREVGISFQNHCNSAVFPIFRFCLHHSITLLMPNTFTQPQPQQRPRSTHPSLLHTNKSQPLCFHLQSSSSSHYTSFQLVIANNYSRYDDYKVELALIQPKLSISNIAFQRQHRINHETFIKHYFSALTKATQHELLAEEIEDRYRVIPLYLTSQDYEEEFDLFKGERYFQIENHAAKDVEFTHFGFQNRENISEWTGISISAVDQPQQSIFRLARNSKTAFKLAFCLSQPFEFNLSSPFFHKKITLYLYNQEEYYLSLILLVRVADNVVQKLKASSQPTSPQAGKFLYIFLNFISFAYICLVVVSFQREEADKKKKIEIALQKQKKIIPQKKEQKQPIQIGFIEEKLRNNSHQLLPESIGTRLKPEEQQKYVPQFMISQEELAFFKSLKVEKEKEKDKSVISESSEDPVLRVTNEQGEKSSQKILNNDKDFHYEQESKQNSDFNDPLEPSQQQSQESQESLSQSILPDGISVCNEQLDTLDEFQDFQFGFQLKRSKEDKVKKEQEFGYYDVFSTQNPLRQQKPQQKQNPFPWMNQLQKKKSQSKKMKQKPQ